MGRASTVQLHQQWKQNPLYRTGGKGAPILLLSTATAELGVHKSGRGLLENRRTCFKDMTQSYGNQGEREVGRDILEKLTIAKC